MLVQSEIIESQEFGLVSSANDIESLEKRLEKEKQERKENVEKLKKELERSMRLQMLERNLNITLSRVSEKNQATSFF